MNALRLRRLQMRVWRIVRSKLGRGSKVYARHRVDEYRRIWSRAAAACGAEVTEIAPDVWRATRGGSAVLMRSGEIQLDDPVTLHMAGRKPLIHRLLRDAGLEVPDHAVFGLDDLRPAHDLLDRHPVGIVVKPASGTAAGDGVSTHVATARRLRRAAALASLYDAELLAEAQVAGESYRALVVGGRMLHVVCRRGQRLRGDGRRSVRELAQALDDERASRGLRPVELDADCAFTLRWQGLDPDSVPAEGMEVLLRVVENPEGGRDEIRTVYDTVVTDLVCDEVRASVETAAAVLGSDFVGVDLIMTDPTRPLSETGGCINEVNTTPALHHHYDAKREEYPTVAADVLDLALRRRAERLAGAGSAPPARPLEIVRDS